MILLSISDFLFTGLAVRGRSPIGGNGANAVHRDAKPRSSRIQDHRSGSRSCVKSAMRTNAVNAALINAPKPNRRERVSTNKRFRVWRSRTKRRSMTRYVAIIGRDEFGQIFCFFRLLFFKPGRQNPGGVDLLVQLGAVRRCCEKNKGLWSLHTRNTIAARNFVFV